jgi:hypothetical protein
MPNWCSNNLFITGPKKLIQELFEKNEASLQKLIPCPQELMDIPSPAPKEFIELNTKKYGESDWYNWCVKNWGTKWDPGPFSGYTSKSEKRGHLSFECSFDSAWAPPCAAFEKLSEKYPQLEIKLEYFESGCRFFGAAIGSNGSWSDDFREYEDAADLENQLHDCPCELAAMELDYLKEMEAEEEESNAEESVASPVKPDKKKASVKKKSAKGVAKDDSSSVKKVAKKAIKTAAKVGKKEK